MTVGGRAPNLTDDARNSTRDDRRGGRRTEDASVWTCRTGRLVRMRVALGRNPGQAIGIGLEWRAVLLHVIPSMIEATHLESH